jgi:hypothetical protein
MTKWFGVLALVSVLGASRVAAAEAQSTEVYLETIGALAGTDLYKTYMYIGAIADGFAKKAFSAGEVTDLTGEITRMMSVVTEHLTKVRGAVTDDSDKRSLDEMASIYRLLNVEAASLGAYAKSSSRADLTAYDNARKAALPTIKKLLGIKG